MADLHDTGLKFLATAARGTERNLRRELHALGIERTWEVKGGVEFRGRLADAMRACLWLRTANRVLLELGEDRLQNERQLYPSVRALPLLEHFTADATLSIDAHVRGLTVKDRRYATMVCKDAIVDTIRDRWGRRPDVDRDKPAIRFTVQVIDQIARYYLDLSGAPLHERGYRQAGGEAPMKETLAAALLHFSRWDGLSPLHDAFCGSGTLLAEAAMIATDTAPGRMRAFGFHTWPRFDEGWMRVWSELMQEARDRAKPRVRGILTGGDTHGPTLHAARQNLRALGIEGVVLEQADFASTITTWSRPGWYVSNPPYGERLKGDGESVEMLHVRLADVLESRPGNHATLITTEEALQTMEMEPQRTARVFNGRIPCVFAHFDLGEDASPTA